MGLDMYLTAERYFWNGEPAPVIDGHTIKSVRAEAACWRKANQIHKWFVDNIQEGRDECQEHFVGREQLIELRDLCKKAIHTNDPTLLPPQPGFFFGSTEIDQYCWDDLQDTIDQIDDALNKFSDAWYFHYRSSW